MIVLLICLIQGCTTSKPIAEPINITTTCDVPTIVRPSPILYRSIAIVKTDNGYLFSEEEFKKLINWLGSVDVYVSTFRKIVDTANKKSEE